MSEPEGEGKFWGVGGLRKRATEGDPKSKKEGRLGDFRSGESQGGGQGCRGERVLSCCSPGSTSDPTALAQGQSRGLLFPSPSLTSVFATHPVSLWGRPLLPTWPVCPPSSTKIRCDLEDLEGR